MCEHPLIHFILVEIWSIFGIIGTELFEVR